MDLEELRAIVLEIDEEMRQEGIPVEQRSFRLRGRLSNRLKSWALYETPEQRVASEILESLYPWGSMGFRHAYTGAFYYKDAIYPLGVGTVLGRVTLQLESFIVGLSPDRWHQLKGDPAAHGRYIDQCCDVADLNLGLGDLRQRGIQNPVLSRLEAGVGHLQSASEAATGHIARDGIMHSTFLSAEVLLKGGLLAAGFTDGKLKSIGHNYIALVAEFSETFPQVDKAALERAGSFLPKSVSERYEHMAYSTEAAGYSIMACQFIGGEVFRLLTKRDLRSSLKLDGSPYRPERSFP